MPTYRAKIAPDKRATIEDLEHLATFGLKFRRAHDNGAAFTRTGEQPHGIEEARKHFEVDGLQVFKAYLKDAKIVVVDIDRPDLPLGRALVKEFKASGTLGCESRTTGFHFFLKAGDWVDSIVGEPDIKDDEGNVIAELKKTWITLYKQPKQGMPILDISDERVANWRAIIEKVKSTRPERPKVEIEDVDKAIADWEQRVISLPEGNHNQGFTEILGELKSVLWGSGQRDFALHVARRLVKIYDERVSPGDTSFTEERLCNYWFPVRESIEEKPPVKADPPAKKKEGKAPSKPDILNEVMLEYVWRRFGGWKGFHLIVKSEGETKVKKAVCWDTDKKRWIEPKFSNLRGSIVGEIHEEYLDQLKQWNIPMPNMLNHDRQRTAIVKNLVNASGETEEFLADFDRPSNKRFLYGEYGVCEVVTVNPDAPPEERKYKLTTGGTNNPLYRLRRDIEGEIADDEEYEQNYPHLMLEFEKYFPRFQTDHENSYNGNWLLDGLQLHIASGFVDMQLRPLGICWGTGNNGKSNFWRYICMALGTKVANPGLDESTFTDGSGSVTTGPRLAAHRAALVGPALCIVPEAPQKAALDSGFIKRFTSKDEPVPVGGMYKDDINVVLECVAFMSTNNVPNIYDQKKGMHRRLYLYPFLETFADKPLSQDVMDGKFLWLLPTIRRWVFEGIKRLVEVYDCSLPEQHSTILAYREEFDEIAQSDIKSELSKCFRKVNPTKEKSEMDYYYQSRRARQGFVGGVAAEDKGVAIDMNDSWFGIMLAVKIIIKACSIRQDKYSRNKIKEILKELGFEFNGSMITNIVHTDHFLEMVSDTFGAERIPSILRAMYRHYKNGTQCAPYNLDFDRNLPASVSADLPDMADFGVDENAGDVEDL